MSSHLQLQNHPKFLMQVNRQQPIPKLISINDFTSNTNESYKSRNNEKSFHEKQKQKQNNKNHTNTFYNSYDQYEQFQLHNNQLQLQQNRNNHLFDNTKSNLLNINKNKNKQSFHNTRVQQNQSQLINQNTFPSSSAFYNTHRKQLPITQARNYRVQVIRLQKLIQIQKQQKLQLQQIIKQLTIQSQKLKQVNEHLVERLKQIEKNFVDEKINQEKQLQNTVRKAVSKVYQQIQDYLRYEIETVTSKLKGQKMTPIVEKKLELFMQSLLQINQNTVEMLKLSQRKRANTTNLFYSRKSNEKQNLGSSNLKMNELSLFYDDKYNKNSSTNKKNSKKRQQSSPQSIRRLINNSYISSYKQNEERGDSPSHIVFDNSNKKQIGDKDYSTILKHLQNHESFRNDESPQGRLSFQNNKSIDNFRHKNYTNNASKQPIDQNRLGDSFVQRKTYYETSNYKEKNFNVKQYTPNKRRKIFDNANRSKSRSKPYESNTLYD